MSALTRSLRGTLQLLHLQRDRKTAYRVLAAWIYTERELLPTASERRTSHQYCDLAGVLLQLDHFGFAIAIQVDLKCIAYSGSTSRRE
ncbi:hypothetical protein SAMN05428989_1533 [Pseudoxanthomonas sp. GM95]|uniref:hypothetical protein n=1 Tax=Pseudoxanthomonas sp. GM95 TaxID=1881043 RepID=UPI0008C8DF60|nr:hypothetical protein [Pseudoxanthomonas sp. GM95]SEL14066.1 hypothetical protein SAMN05428989_1533 [Pseudoxanthomonas sp. GM95]